MVEDLELPLKGQPLTVRLLAHRMSENAGPFWGVVSKILSLSTDEELKAIFFLVGRELKRRKRAKDRGMLFR